MERLGQCVEPVGFLRGLVPGEHAVFLPIAPGFAAHDVHPAALDEVPGQPDASGIGGEPGAPRQRRVEQAEQAVERPPRRRCAGSR